jgi:hypothetical protein
MLVIENVIKKVLNEELNHTMKLTRKVKVSEDLKYHLDNKLTLTENVFRIYSESYFNLINEVRNLHRLGFIKLNENDKWIVESDLGKSVLLESGKRVWLDAPFEESQSLMEAVHRGKKVKLGSPFRTPGGPKKFAVYVKSDSGGEKKVTFGDPNLSIKRDNPERRKAYRARHGCEDPGPKTKANYWSCRAW